MNKGDVRLIFDEHSDAQKAARWLEEVTQGRISMGKPYRGRKGGYIVRGNMLAVDEGASVYEGEQ